ncbi:TetR/AcrR family transcriptional regulator [Olsenella profusa]|uniref:TetR/AcrR family transcriptional regulator n=1 Tax=Olsenella profusa TaxID=138595 RepID=A0ABS2F0W4_9ACTN|nr:TetR/AcrR family transcriptional regulator [Olsenella profusa]MBM6774192.1 TetR/AcrR family transcriptional regulator [Olsenella profusa]
MDRRRRKTRAAIFSAFEGLLAEQPYASITVRQIIERADVGRTTFYDNFETKDDLLRVLCDDLFGHVEAAAAEHAGAAGEKDVGSVFCHLLWHLREGRRPVLRLLAGENSEVLTRAFVESLRDLVATQVSGAWAQENDVPTEFLVSQVAGGFVEMVRWWARGGCAVEPEELDRWFRTLMGPALA